MPSWWGKFTSKKANKEKKDKIFDKIQRKLKSSSQETCNDKSRGTNRDRIDSISNKESQPPVPSRSLSPSRLIFCCKKIVERPNAQPLSFPLPMLHPPSHVNSEISAPSELGSTRGLKPRHVSNMEEPIDGEGDISIASNSSDGNYSDIIIDDPFNLMVTPFSPLAHGCENGNKTTMHSSARVARNDKSLTTIQKSSIPSTKATSPLCNNDILPKVSKRDAKHMQNLQIPRPGGFWSPTDSSVPSSSRSPMRRTFGPEQVLNSGICTSKPYPDVASRHYSSPRPVHNIRHDLIGGDLQRHKFRPHNRCNLESSPISSPRKTSSNLKSRIHSRAITPLHPLETHNGCLSPTSYSVVQTSSPRNPGSEILTSPSKWKKGRFLGQGTFGQVFLGFNSDSGMMCAMKEVTLFPDDAKSMESAKQLHQEVALLSHLRHANIVHYYGSETVGDKLYIYLEYAAGGSIYTLLQQHGQLGEDAIRSYTGQILSGLEYLHARNIVHRDIKGANVLVSPNGTVKLADFGVAKHTNGQPCPFSLKGSPHWMAPEVIKNPNGCTLAVDIWSLGCTILEMATTKPPWSHHEGAAVLFKLGNSDELPVIPNYLSKEGKDFVHLCLQRDPLCRPSAAQLLLHPFVKNITLERPIQDIRPEKVDSCLHSKAGDVYLPRSLRISSRSSNVHSPKNISCPVSPTKSPLLPSRPLHVSGRMSPSPTWTPNIASGSSSSSLRTSGSDAISFYQPKHTICSPHNASNSSSLSPRTCGTGVMPLHQTRKPTFSPEALGVIQRPQNVSGRISPSPTCHPHTASNSSSLSPRNSGSSVIPYHQSKQSTYSHERLGVIQRPQNSLQTLHNSYALRDTTFQNDILENHNRKKTIQGGDSTQFHDEKSYLPDYVPQLQLRGQMKLN